MDKKKIQEFIDDSVQGYSNGLKSQPRFYVISGSRLYGFDSDDSDFDIRGFHTVPADSYSYLDDPEKEIRINNDGITEGYENYDNYELISYELKKFGELLYTANYNIIEQLLCSEPVVNGIPLEIDTLRKIIKDHLPLDVPESYYGMAKNQYYKHLDNDSERYDPSPKSYLYVYRGLIAAKYVQDKEDVIADVEKLASRVDLVDEKTISKLIELKSEGVDKVDKDMRSDLQDEIIDLYSEIQIEDVGEKEKYKQDINSWMKSIR